MPAPSGLHRRHLSWAAADRDRPCIERDVHTSTFRHQVSAGAEEHVMKRFTFLLAIGALAVGVHGCASTSPESSASGPVPAASSFAQTGLPGAWQGYFTTTGSIGDSRMIHGDYTFKISEDGT